MYSIRFDSIYLAIVYETLSKRHTMLDESGYYTVAIAAYDKRDMPVGPVFCTYIQYGAVGSAVQNYQQHIL